MYGYRSNRPTRLWAFDYFCHFACSCHKSFVSRPLGAKKRGEIKKIKQNFRIMKMSKTGFRGPSGTGEATRFKPGISGNPKGRPRKNTLKFSRLIEAGEPTRWRPGQSGNPKGRPPDGVMTPTRQRRQSKWAWREFRELCRAGII